ncbi:MAG TPA: nitrate/nitrite transporter NrtS [Candidatus Acidoferrales bacterium]|nr:nitrate/nitrite transporter NrtS [Candidatus Acidoferrales bacterium]
MKERFQLALRPSVVKRAHKYALVVGFILIAIHHSDAILSGHIMRGVWVKMLPTVMVPYVVSTFSSVGVLLEMRGRP